MQYFKDTRVNRAGLTAEHWTNETNKSNSYYISGIGSIIGDEEFRKNLCILISIASAGGGTTCLSIDIGHDDLQAIFKLIAKEAPESAALFSECTTIAINSMRKELLYLDEH